mmetsp:Transcript_60482/g.124460  ORF Transcript_60482/g.124460 Transcript_60482/m.124460 type:complete len:213 (-) Transcript_60482:1586-2224(-)
MRRSRPRRVRSSLDRSTCRRSLRCVMAAPLRHSSTSRSLRRHGVASWKLEEEEEEEAISREKEEQRWCPRDAQGVSERTCNTWRCRRSGKCWRRRGRVGCRCARWLLSFATRLQTSASTTCSSTSPGSPSRPPPTAHAYRSHPARATAWQSASSSPPSPPRAHSRARSARARPPRGFLAATLLWGSRRQSQRLPRASRACALPPRWRRAGRC